MTLTVGAESEGPKKTNIGAVTSTIQLSAAVYRVNERLPKAVLTVTRTGSVSTAASVNFTTNPNTADAGVDYLSATGALNWAAGESASKLIEIDIVQDAFEEEPQDFYVVLSSPTGGVLGARSTAQVILEESSARFEELYSSVYAAPAELTLLVSLTAFTATKVEFVEGNTILGVSAVPRGDGFYSFVWSNVPRGNYTLRAVASDANGVTVTSPSRTILIVGTIQGAGLATVHVDRNNQTQTENGSVERPFTTIQKGIDNAAPGGVVKVASGTYAESILIENTTLQVLGGYAGARSADYANGQSGDFSTRDLVWQRVIVQPTKRRTGFGLYNAQTTEVDGFTIIEAARGFFIVGDPVSQSYPKLRRNVIAANGEALRAHGGGGIHAESSSLELIENEISFNSGGRGGGVSAGGNQASIVMRNNLIRGNIGYDDHGGGLYIIANGVIAGNRFENNEVGKAVDYGGWGGGLIIFGNSADFFPQIVLSNNVFTGNYAGNGSAVFFDEGARATMDHELIYGNRTMPGAGGAIYVDGCCNTSLIVKHSTIVNNEGYREGNGLNTDTGSSATVTNSIFWNNGGDEFAAFSGSTLRISYTLAGDAITTGAGIIAGPGNLRTDPLFADAANNDYRLKSTRGRWSPAAGVWVQDAVNSPAIDTGAPTSDFSWEALPNGGRVDLGVYGNRTEVSLIATIVPTGVRIVVNGANGRPYRLERGDNLETWSEVTMLTTTTGQLDYVDPLAQSGPRFYRLRQ